MATKSMLEAANESLTKEANVLRYCKDQVAARKKELQNLLAAREHQRAQIDADINHIRGAIQDTEFWSTKLNAIIHEDMAVVEQLREQGVDL